MQEWSDGIGFGSEITGEAHSAERREWLVTNGLGGYACGTVAGSLSRSYHGFLIAALRPPLGRTLLVAKLQDTALADGRSFPLSSDRRADGGIDPCGHRSIESFALEGTVPVWRHGVADALLEKRIWMEPAAHTTYGHYRLLRGTGPLRLRLRVLVQHRSHHGGGMPSLTAQRIERGIRVDGGEAQRPLRLLIDRADGHLTLEPQRLEQVRLEREAERGLPLLEENVALACFELHLSPERPCVTVTASIEDAPHPGGEAALARRRDHEQRLLGCWREAWPQLAARAPVWIRQLVLAADAFIVQRTPPRGGHSVIAGYPWFGDWGRDALISLAGLTLVTGRPQIGEGILRSFAAHVDRGMVPNLFAAAGRADYTSVDAGLWLFQALRDHHRASGNLALVADLFPVLEEILRHHCRGTRHGIRRDPADGLLTAGEGETQLTWMDAKVDGRAITPRHGKPVEVNALWCNALATMARFASLLGRDAAPHEALAAQARSGFQRFWSEERGHCLDVLDGPDGRADASLRPNQLLAVSLPQRLLSPARERAIVDLCARRLLTRHGLRSLDPADPRYRGSYGGDRLARDEAYHQGTVWGWLIGPFALAWNRVHRDPVTALGFLEPMGHHLRDAGLGSLSEIFDGDPPHAPRGCIAQAWTVAEVLRAWAELSLLLPRR